MTPNKLPTILISFFIQPSPNQVTLGSLTCVTYQLRVLSSLDWKLRKQKYSVPYLTLRNLKLLVVMKFTLKSLSIASIPSLIDYIHSLFVKCLLIGRIPSEWKNHKISPIPKNKDLLDISNYRPISLLCILSKVLESIISSKIIDFVCPKISKQQYGFMKNKSCCSQLLSAFAIVYEALDKRNKVDMIYLDFCKAFDSVPHKELLYKLWRIGITGDLWLWFKNYLSDRSHYVQFNNVASPTEAVLSGVPQGSILGPLLFIIYVNDIPDIITYSSCFLFADDVKLLKTINTMEDHQRLEDDLKAISDWCKQWNLALNPTKCNAIQFSTQTPSQELAPYTIGQSDIPFVNSQKDLGVIVSNSLSWSEHFDLICSKAYQALYVIRRNIPPHSPIQLKKILYCSLVKSQITYCCQLWQPQLIKHIQSLERIQRKATKYIF